MIEIRQGNDSIFINKDNISTIEVSIEEGYDTNLMKHVKRHEINIYMIDGTSINSWTYSRKEHLHDLSIIKKQMGGNEQDGRYEKRYN